MRAATVDVLYHAETSSGEALATAYEGDAGFDLASRIQTTLAPFERASIPCGVSLAIPNGYAGLVLPRSGLAIKHGISVVNGPGLIDSGYRGEICAILVNLDPHEPFTIHEGDRIAQLMIVPYASLHLVSCENLPESERGTQGFGSSGV